MTRLPVSRLRILLAIVCGCGAVLSPAACAEYDSSLLHFTDADADAADVSAEPEAAADAQQEPEAAVDDAADASAADAGDAKESEPPQDTGPDAPVCSATQVDCDADTSNGCETNLNADAKHCGWCSHDCLGTLCAAGMCVPTTLASGQSTPSNIAHDDTYVYWTNSVQNGAVMRVKKSGGTPEIVAASANTPGGLAVDSSAVYWSEVATGSSVWRLDKSGLGDGGAPVALATGQASSMTLTVDDGMWVYWCTTNAVRKVPKAGGTVEIVAPGMSQPGGIVSDLGILFWTDVTAGIVYNLDTPDGPLVTMATGQSFPTGIATDFTAVYWTNMVANPDAGVSGIMWMSKTAMQPTVLVATEAGALGVAQSGPYVYWANNVTGTVNRVPKAGGTPNKLAEGQGAPAAIAVDSSWVYWTNRDDGKVMKVAK